MDDRHFIQIQAEEDRQDEQEGQDGSQAIVDVGSLIYTLHKRVGHIVVPYKHYILIWGGFMSSRGDQELYCSTNHIWFYNCITEVWTLGQTSGYLPSRNSGSTGVVCEDYLYIYGGVKELTQQIWRYSCELHRLNLKTLQWNRVNPDGVSPQGCDKGVGWTYNNRIYFFGGYGHRSKQFVKEYSFDMDNNNIHGNRGWNNQLTIYDPSTNHWHCPKTNGLPPKPRAAHAADVSGNKVCVFGGRRVIGRVNDIYILDLDDLTWTNLRLKDGVHEIPEGRSWHSFNFISENRAIVYGGLNQQGYPCTDWWECTIDGKEVSWELKGKMKQALVWHKAGFSQATNELIIVGGVNCSPYLMKEKNHVDTLHIVPFSPRTLFRSCIEEIVKKDIWRESDIPEILVNIIVARKIQKQDVKSYRCIYCT